MKKLTLLLLVALVLVGGSVSADEFRTIRTNGKLVKSKYPAFAIQTLTEDQTTPVELERSGN